MTTNQPINQPIALLIPAHNEELVLANTVEAALMAGVPTHDIFLVDDSSSDNTLAIARDLLGYSQVLHVERSGKAMALQQAVEHFKLIEKYEWIQIIDADSMFSPDYFEQIRQYFKPGVAAVCGQVKSLQNTWITSYRAYEYTIFQDFYKILQAKFNLVGVMPGPATCIRSSVLAQLDNANDTLTEDFDWTVQVHHKKLGRIAYAHRAYSWTQDPPTLPIYLKQVNRWYTGSFQVMKKYSISRGFRPVDIMLALLTLDGFFYIGQTVLFIILSLLHLNKISILTLLMFDFMTMFVLVSYAAIRMRRIDILSPLPFYYILRVCCMSLFIWAAFKVHFLQRSPQVGAWNTKRVTNSAESVDALLKGGVAS